MRKWALRMGIAIGSMLLTYVSWSQEFPCTAPQPCPEGCYQAEFLRFDWACAVSGVFPNQRCCLTVYAVYACRENPDCTGGQCGITKQIAAELQGYHRVIVQRGYQSGLYLMVGCAVHCKIEQNGRIRQIDNLHEVFPYPKARGKLDFSPDSIGSDKQKGAFRRQNPPTPCPLPPY